MAINSRKTSKHRLCPLVRDIKNRLTNIPNYSNSSHVRFTWCPTHIGIQGNERADSEAKKAAASGTALNNNVDFSQLISGLSESYKKKILLQAL